MFAGSISHEAAIEQLNLLAKLESVGGVDEEEQKRMDQLEADRTLALRANRKEFVRLGSRYHVLSELCVVVIFDPMYASPSDI